MSCCIAASALIQLIMWVLVSGFARISVVCPWSLDLLRLSAFIARIYWASNEYLCFCYSGAWLALELSESNCMTYLYGINSDFRFLNIHWASFVYRRSKYLVASVFYIRLSAFTPYCGPASFIVCPARAIFDGCCAMPKLCTVFRLEYAETLV
jgi:hypothetical protein